MLDRISTQVSLAVLIFYILKEIFREIFQLFLVTAQGAVGLVTWLAWDGCLLMIREMRHGQPQGSRGCSRS